MGISVMRKSRALLVSLSLCACSAPLVSVTCLCKARGETRVPGTVVAVHTPNTERSDRGPTRAGPPLTSNVRGRAALRRPGEPQPVYMEYALKSVIVNDTFYFLRDSTS